MRAGDRRQIGLRDLFAEIGLIGRLRCARGGMLGRRSTAIPRSTNAVSVSAAVSGRPTAGSATGRRPRAVLLGLVASKLLLGLPGIEAGLARLLRDAWDSREDRCRQHQCNEDDAAARMRAAQPLTVV